jgi:pyridoxamine 5'-phosphate oxidase
MALLARWLDDAGGSETSDAIAMCVATVGASGAPSARIVLLRGLDDRGLRFFTSYHSRKARELAINPHAAAVLYWPRLQRQVRIEGVVSQLGDDESDDYFGSRPRGHRIAAWASEQSEPLESYEVLEERFEHFTQRFEGEDVPRPHSWGGYVLSPARVEFWQGRPNRMHDRRLYIKTAGDWSVTLLQP